MPSYNYEEAIQLRKEGYTNAECAQHFGYSGEAGFRRRHKRELKARAKASTQSTHSNKKNVYTNNANNVHTQSNNSAHNVDNNVVNINSIKYGDLPPTMYISDLDHIEWGMKYLNHKWSAPYLKEMANELWDRMKLLLLTGRHHGKTWTMIKLFVRWLLEQRTQVLVICNPAKYDDIYNGVKYALMSNEIRKQYGDVIDLNEPNSRSSGIITFKPEFRKNRDGSIMDGGNFMILPSSVDATQVGKHASGGWVHLEDVTQHIKVSEEAEERVRIWYDRTVRYIRGKDTKITATGTRKDPKDFYWHLQENHYFPTLVQKGFVIESGRLPRLDEISVNHEYEIVTDWPHAVGTYSILGCPDYPIERLLYEFIFHAHAAEAELNNSPLPRSGNYFDIDDWIEQDFDGKLADVWQNQPKYIIMDPAFGKSGSSSKTAILVLMIYQARIWIIDAIVKRLSLTRKEKALKELAENYNPKWIFVENNFGQISTRYDNTSIIMNLRGLKLFNAENDKKERIAALDFPYKKREIIMYENCNFKQDIYSEYLQFSMTDGPTEIKQKYNALDALASAYERLKMFLGGASGLYSRTWNSPR